MVVIIKKKGESKDSLFRKFSRIIFEEEMVDEVRKRLFYKKPSLVRKEEEKERMKRRFSKGKSRFAPRRGMMRNSRSTNTRKR